MAANTYVFGRSKFAGMGPPMLTSGALAELLQVAPRSAAKWIDNGKIKSIRLPSCNGDREVGDRRVTIHDAIRFCRDRGFTAQAQHLLNFLKPTAHLIDVPDTVSAAVQKWLLPYQVSVREVPHPIAAAVDFAFHAPVLVVLPAWCERAAVVQLHDVAQTAAERFGWGCATLVYVHTGDHIEDDTRAMYSANEIAATSIDTLSDALKDVSHLFPLRAEVTEVEYSNGTS